jgi:ABC-type sugar transport system substrate-binding protein
MKNHGNPSAIRYAAIAMMVAYGPVGGVAAAEKQVTIGFAAPIIANPWWKANADLAVKLGEQLGAKVLVCDGNEQEDKQIKCAEDFIAQGVDGIVAAPVIKALGPALLQRAENAGIKMSFAERTPGIRPEDYKGNAYVGFVGTDQEAGGYDQAKRLYGLGVRKVVGIVIKKGNSVGEARLAGWQKFAAETRDFKILQYEYGNELREDAVKTMESMLSAYPGPGFDGVLCISSDAALGVIQVLKQAGVLDKVKVAALDADTNGVTALENGELQFSTGGSFVDGAFATIMLFDAIKGHMPKNRWVDLNFMFVNKGNVAAYKKAYVDGLPPYDAKKLSVTFNPHASTDDYVVQ